MARKFTQSASMMVLESRAAKEAKQKEAEAQAAKLAAKASKLASLDSMIQDVLRGKVPHSPDVARRAMLETMIASSHVEDLDRALKLKLEASKAYFATFPAEATKPSDSEALKQLEDLIRQPLKRSWTVTETAVPPGDKPPH